ncbi:Major facilitator superfamily transporter [Desulfonema limicola]|uniref:Major facilitator superfamily transporter n=2 Tax=Desulfonema limicola TaxID=45656 RepID=A0A975GEW6_9BACT|nr:Major facilitator superfamily transporter [Desulfonema limicola]
MRLFMKINNKISFKWIMGTQYFLYFGVMGIILPYFNLYCFHLNFTGLQIGLLSSVRSVSMILFPVLWGIFADRFRIRRPIYIFCNFMSAGIWIFYFFTTEFNMMFLIAALYSVFYAPIISFMEAFTMDVLNTEKQSYGKIRVWGTIAFIIIVVLIGKLIDLYSVNIILGFIFAGSLIQALISVNIPDIKAEKNIAFVSGADFLRTRHVIIFLICAFMMLFSHGTYYGFFSIHLEKLGFGKTFIGFAWALASIAEILVMINSNRIFKRFSLEDVMFFSFITAGARWLILYFAESQVIILASQCLHAITYGTFHIASILYIDRASPEESKTMGQAVNNALTYGLGTTAGIFLSGYFFESLGAFNLFLVCSLIAFTGGLIIKRQQSL